MSDLFNAFYVILANITCCKMAATQEKKIIGLYVLVLVRLHTITNVYRTKCEIISMFYSHDAVTPLNKYKYLYLSMKLIKA